MQQRVKGRPLLLEQVAQVNIDLSLESDNTSVHVISVTNLHIICITMFSVIYNTR